MASIKQNRKQRTKTLSNTTHPVWQETLTVIINDPDKQSLTFQLMDDDPGAFDDVRLLVGLLKFCFLFYLEFASPKVLQIDKI